MIIHYASNKLEKILTDKRLIKKYYSNDFNRINNRMSELMAANNLSEIPEVPPPRRHKLNGNWKNCWGIDFSKNDRFIISPKGVFDINDISSIVEIEIIDLEDYH
ncbi:MAG: plasmid maintenance system killer protein [Lachnospiraceae bacterium]|nr:plasmid maintenance system killer protein [Lachnospiraceae bacterium]